jgi:hypothetical protein
MWQVLSGEEKAINMPAFLPPTAATSLNFCGKPKRGSRNISGKP